MTSQVIFKIDKKLKEAAMRKAQNDGLPFALILKLATQAFVEGALDVGLIGVEKLRYPARKALRSVEKDILLDKNISPPFKTAKRAMEYLNS